MAYAVLDVETTGLRPSWHDRIVEIAIVQVSDAGEVEAEWCTLVNPERDLGPQRIHGISAAEARQAPRFKDLAGTVAELLRTRIPVAHNWAFDSEFIAYEFERLGFSVPIREDTGLCTMHLAGQFLPEAGRSLAACCRTARVKLVNAHSALYDARAAAGLLAHFLSLAGSPPPWMRRFAGGRDWPNVPGSAAASSAASASAAASAGASAAASASAAAVAVVSRRAQGHVEPHFLSRLVERLPRTHRPTADAYLDVLDRSLLDRHISAVEANALVAVADRLGLAREDLDELHRHYLQALATVAALDGEIGENERADLERLADLLAVEPEYVDGVLSTARHAVALAGGPSASPSKRLYLRRGDEVVFTGETKEPRETWEARAARAGLRVGKDVTTRTRLLVAADPDTMSGKAEKAARFGIPIVHPSAFSRMIQKIGEPEGEDGARQASAG